MSEDRYFRAKAYRSTGKVHKLFCLSRDMVVSHVEEPEVLFLFRHIDGMYSYCETSDQQVYHPVAWSKVILWEEVT
jgi:hypothetical protein